jgi:hypothetical protein
MGKLVVGLRSFILLCAVQLVFCAFDVAYSAPAGAKSKASVVSVSDPTFQSCKFHIEPALQPILANQNLCILVGKQTSSTQKGRVYVWLIGPSTIDERNSWINEAGKWLKTQGLDPCAEKTDYITDPYSPVKPPLANQVGGTPGEKAFYGLGGLDKPSFCPQPCPGSNRLDRLGRCSKGEPLPQRLSAEAPKIEKAALKRDFVGTDQRYNYLFDFDFINALAQPIEIVSVNVFDTRGQRVEQDWAISGPNYDPRILTHELSGNHPLVKIFSKPGRGTPLEQATVSSVGGRMEIKVTNRILSAGRAIRPSGYILGSKNKYDSLSLRVAYRVNGNLQEVSRTFTVGMREEEKPLASIAMPREPKGTGKYLIVLVHGCCTSENKLGEWDTLGGEIQAKLKKKEEWEIVVRDWTRHTPDRGLAYRFNDIHDAYEAAPSEGKKLADLIVTAIKKSAVDSYEYVHFIGHSAGARLIHEASKRLAANKKRPFIHLTFLDAYTWDNDKNSYGSSADYAEHYVDRGFAAGPASTDENLVHAFNFDITNWQSVSQHEKRDNGHQWPRDWYQKSVKIPGFSRYGFPLSLEGGADAKKYRAIKPPGPCMLQNKDSLCNFDLPSGPIVLPPLR